ncbi:NLI interacting factor (NIF) family protein [Acanthamoeba castellanii str. Neff]|uniref:NLI interacting factor (NIF) family protein n=1 Tax=Acanthamoeba castellanii (strain ATCC 30010 / Neff) TaxID=1257118 RepID=L8GNS5_ACACF|nr:NLI interacting factor (NIF) family protein [Acanthamoeba castellanii str. Neff]ELR14604.1 NLI interacting factor (NIF) family protein [Acanthamoeba castellanii str. Neff]
MTYTRLLFVRLPACLPACLLDQPTSSSAQCAPQKPTLVLDLDETLVHSTIEPPPPGSPPPGNGCCLARFCTWTDLPHCIPLLQDHVFSVTLENTTYNVFVRVRPNMHRFLAEVAKLFEEAYAGRLLDMLDTERHIGHRLYRDACVLVEGNFVKDLDMLGRDLQHTTIVDNSPLAFAYHLDNGIPIESWFGERSDNHLLALMPFLRELARADDVRPLIRKKYAVVQNRHTTFTY